MTQPKLTRKQIERIRDDAVSHGNVHQFGWDFRNADIAALADFALKAIDALGDMAEHGTRHDLTPTCMFKNGANLGPPRTNGYDGYIKEMDDYVREKAREALSLIDLGRREGG